MSTNINFGGGFRSLQNLMNSRSELAKYASDGFHSTVPGTDPGLVEPTTGPTKKEQDRMIEESAVSNVTAVNPDLDESGVFGWNWGTETLEADDHGAKAKRDNDDPGTQSPISAEKASAFAACSFEQNVEGFRKYAAACLRGAQPVQVQRAAKLAAVVATAENDALLLAKHATAISNRMNAQNPLFKLASELEGMTDEELAQVDAELSDPAPPTDAAPPEEIAAVEQAIAELPPEEQEAVAVLAEGLATGAIAPEELEQYVEDCDSEGCDFTPEEQASLENLSEQDLELVDALLEAASTGAISPEELQGLAEEGLAMQAEEAAVAELSSAMTEEGVTPEDLEALNKEGAATFAAHVRKLRNDGRYVYKAATLPEERTLREHFRGVLREWCR